MAKNKSANYHRRFQLKNDKELKCEALLLPYESSFQYHVFFINEVTISADVDVSPDITRITSKFVIDTESTFKTHHPALLQIFLSTGGGKIIGPPLVNAKK